MEALPPATARLSEARPTRPVAGPALAERRRAGGLARVAAIALLAVATVSAGGLALPAMIDQGNTVELRVDGQRRTFDTEVATVGRLLDEQRVPVGEFDRVVPARSTRVRDGLTVTVLRAFPITRDLDGDIQTVYTTYASPSDYLRRDLRAGDQLVIRSAPQRLQANSTIILRTPHRGRLLIDAQAVDYTVPALDVAELLAQYSVELGPEDYVHTRAGERVTAETRLVDGEEYTVVRVGRELLRIEEPYSAPSERHPDADMPVGESRVEPGEPGVMTVTYEVTRRNGEEVERKVVSRVPRVVARPTITYYGTKADPMWDRIAQCETGGNWAMRGPLFSGGLGFYNGTWDAFGGHDFAPNAGMASREEQIIVAERIRSSVGIGGWGCARILGYVR